MSANGKAKSIARARRRQSGKAPPHKLLVVDIGGSKIKILLTSETEPRKVPSGKQMTPSQMVDAVKALARGWDYEAVSIGYPGLVGENGPRAEPGNLGSGWVGFDYAAAFGCPVRIVNDAAMQALGSYEGGRMLFLGLGTGLGSAFIANNVIVTLELGELIYTAGKKLGEVLGRDGLKNLGRKTWRSVVSQVVPALMSAFVADHVVLGGGNSKEVKVLPAGARLGHNHTAFRGGFRLWHLEDVPTLSDDVKPDARTKLVSDYRLI